MIDTPGNMLLLDDETIVEGDDEVKRYLRRESGVVNDWLYELVDGLVFYADSRLRQHAPGGISDLVGVSLPHEGEPGVIEGIAGVEPDITQATFTQGFGSDPADYPVFVEVGTGIFGPVGEPISTIPGQYLMGPIDWMGREIYVSVIKGQPPQRYAEHSYEELVEHTPVVIKASLPELGRRE